MAVMPALPGFTFVRALGRGGAAVVYLARQEALDRDVAVKVLRYDVDDPKAWKRFQREARTIAQLSGHPHVLSVYTAGRTEAGEPYLVTEYLDRGALADVVAAEGPLPPATVVAIGTAVADALGAAHELGVLHRDVKPENVLLGSDGRIKLGDFGIARLLAGHSATTTDVIAFTPEHVAPEILRGEPDGPWSDLYGLASTLATALAGASLYARRPDEPVQGLMARKLAGGPPALPGSVPSALAATIMSALDPDPARRPSLAEFRRQLVEGTSATQPMTVVAPVVTPMVAAAAPPPAMVDELRPSRVRGAWIAAALLLAALIGGGALLARDLTSGEAGPADTLTPLQVTTSTAASSTVAETVTTTTTTTTIPTTTAAPTTVAPPPTMPPTTTPAPAAPAQAGDQRDGDDGKRDEQAVTEGEAETFLRSYFDAVEAGRYEETWAQLTEGFQRGRARSYDYYSDFWEQNDVVVAGIDVVDADKDKATAEVQLLWNGATDPVVDRIKLERQRDGQLLIAEQTTLEEGEDD